MNLPRKTTTAPIEWNTMLGLLVRLRRDNKLREYLLVCCGCYFGLRAGDLLDLRWRQVMDKDEFLVQEGKTEKARKITINAFVKEALEFVADALTRQGKFHPDNFLFLNRRGQRLTIQYANQSLHQVFEEYGIRVQNGSSHTLRKTFGRRVWEMDNKSERSLIYLSEIFNHSSIAITKRYIGITEKTIADVYLKL